MNWPAQFRPQTLGYMKDYKKLVAKGAAAVRAYFGAHPDEAHRLLLESYDKRYAPSTFIQEHEGGYRVGWFNHGYECTHQFPSFEDAVTDYVLFSYGVGRYGEGP